MMGASSRRRNAVLLLTSLVSTAVAIHAEDKRHVSFPDGYRSWQHVKTIVIGPQHASFSERGGIHHYYANASAVMGYKTGQFPDGAIIIDETVHAQDGEGQAKGILIETGTRLLEVMVKDEKRYKNTGGWGFERFARDDKTGELTLSEQVQCYECHAKVKERDHVFSKLRP